jgi:hypothetical protein
MPRTTERTSPPIGMRSAASVRSLSTASLLVATALCMVAVPGPVHAGKPSWQERYVVRWKKQMRDIDGLLLARSWKEANREAEKLLTEMSREVKAGGGQLTGGALTERSAALAGLGKMHDAEWYAGMADQFWGHTADQLGRYGEVGRRLRGALLSCKQRVRRTDMAGSDEYPKRMKAPVIRTKIPPKYPAGVQAGRGEDKVMVGALVNVHGVPQCPTVEHGTPYVPLVYSVLDALKDWRFKPATVDGHPVEIQYVLTAKFRLSE